MRKIRVLVVDDAVVVRRIVSDVLTGDPSLEVVGVASNGRIALNKIVQLTPDLITLDVEMPEMDGLETLLEIRKRWPRLPVIMFSTVTRRGASATVEALTRGANDYVTKPANVGSVTQAMQQIRMELIPKIKALCPMGQPVAAPQHAPSKLAPVRAAAAGRIDIVAIGCSTGGPNALARILPLFPGNLQVPVLITQHMPPVFTRMLAERLSRQGPFSVEEATQGMELRPGLGYIAPGDFHLRVSSLGGALRLMLDQAEPRNSCRPSVDVMFESVAEVFGARALGVVLTGMGQDGLRGGERICEAGGELIVQDEASSVVWGMPGFVARAGLASAVLALDDLAAAILGRIQRGRAAPAPPPRQAVQR